MSDWQAALDEVEALQARGAYAEALALALESMAEARLAGDVAWQASAHRALAICQFLLQDPEKAQAHIEIGVAISQLNGLPTEEADLLMVGGVLSMRERRLERARRQLEEAYAIYSERGNAVSSASVLNSLGLVSMQEKDPKAALAYYRRELEWLGDIDHAELRSTLLGNIGEGLLNLGELQEAESRLIEALRIELEMGDQRRLAFTYFNFGEWRSQQQRVTAANAFYRMALEIQEGLGEW